MSAPTCYLSTVSKPDDMVRIYFGTVFLQGSGLAQHTDNATLDRLSLEFELGDKGVMTATVLSQTSVWKS